jgi:hypothetical protein
VANDTILDFEFMAGHKMTFEEIVHAWLAFKDLRQRNAIRSADLQARQWERAADAGWHLGWGRSRMTQNYLDRMGTHPFDFFRGHEWGADVYVNGSYELADRFHALAIQSRASAGLPTKFFSEDDVQRGVVLFRNALIQEQTDRKRREQIARGETVDSPPQAYQTEPFILPSPVRTFLWQYGIANGEVYSRKTFMGMFNLGYQPSLKVDRVVDSYAEGGALWGDVVFGNETGPVVRWKNVFRPKATLEQARRVLQTLQTDTAKLDVPKRIERSCPQCAEPILSQARLCKHCHQRVEPTAD